MWTKNNTNISKKCNTILLQIKLFIRVITGVFLNLPYLFPILSDLFHYKIKKYIEIKYNNGIIIVNSVRFFISN